MKKTLTLRALALLMGLLAFSVPADEGTCVRSDCGRAPDADSIVVTSLRHVRKPLRAVTSEPAIAMTPVDVLVWAPASIHADDTTHILEVLTQAYEQIIPTNALYKAKYPAGISVTTLYGTSYSPVDLPESLDAYALVFVVYPYQTITASQVAKLKSVVARGGRVVLQGEHSQYSGTENAVLTTLAKNMGATFSIDTGDSNVYGNDTYNLTCDLFSEKLPAYPLSDNVAPISYSGIAQEVAHTTARGTNYIWCVDEASGNGRITVFSDMNWYCGGASSRPAELFTEAIPFLERLLANAVTCEQKVLDEEDPNRDVEEKIPDGMVAAVRDDNSLLTYYPTVTAACAAAEPDGYTVLLKKDIAEDFTLPIGVTFVTTGITTNYAGVISAPDSYHKVLANDTHDIFKVEGMPAAPAVTASDGSYTDRVTIDWTEPASDYPVTRYKIWRVNCSTGYRQDLADDLVTRTYDDTTAKSGVHYIYHVCALNKIGWGFEGTDEGWRSAENQVPDPVASVSATDGAFADRVEVTWTPAADSLIAVAGYRVRRAQTGASDWTDLAVVTNGLSFVDWNAEPGVDYTYSVQAGNAYGWAASLEDPGWRAISLALDPTSANTSCAQSVHTLAVSANASWIVSSLSGNASATKLSETALRVTVAANGSRSSCASKVTVKAGGSTQHPVTATFTVTQQRQPKLTDLEITPGTVTCEGGGIANFTARATYDDGTTRDVTQEATWTVTPGAYGSISANGVLTTAETTDTNRTATVTATLAQEGDDPVTLTDTASVTITFTSRLKRPMSLTINGDDTIDAGATNAYTATVTYNDGTSAEKTLAAAWSVAPSGTVAQVAKGDKDVKLAAAYTAKGTLTLRAEYAEGVTVAGTKEITVKPMPVLTSIEIVGPSELEGGQGADFTAIAHYDNGSSSNVTALATWSIADGAAYGEIGEHTGELTTFATTELNRSLTVHARFSADLPTPVTVTDDKNVAIGFTRALLAPVSLWITGPTEGALGRTDDYRAYVAFNDATTNEITLDAATAWTLSPANRAETRRTESAFSVTPRVPGVTNTLAATYTLGATSAHGTLDVAVPEIVSLPIAVDLVDAGLATGGLFQVIHYNLNFSPKSIAACESAIVSPSTWLGSPVTGRYETISFRNGDDSHGYPHLQTVSFPGISGGKHDGKYFACLITGKMMIPEPGDWTFACDIDDGFQFDLMGQGKSYVFKRDGITALKTELTTFHIEKAGVYDIRAVYYDQGGNAVLSLAAAKGVYTTFDASVLKVIGTAGSAIRVQPLEEDSDLVLTTGGVNGWFGQLEVNSDNEDAGQSGYIPGAGESWMATTVTNAGTLTFTWKASSESLYDALSFEIDGERKASMSGPSNDWRTLTFEVPLGTHEFRWTYAKDDATHAGADAGWVDRIVWTPTAPPDVVLDVSASDGSSADETLVTWNATANGKAGTVYEVRRAVLGTTDWEVLTSSHAALTYHDTTAVPGVDYTYCVRAGNLAGWGPSALDDGWRACTLALEPTEITFAHGGGSADVSVTANAAWTFAESADWFAASSPSSTVLTVVADANAELTARDDTVTVTVGTDAHALTGTVRVVQAARPARLDVAFARPYEDWRTRMQLANPTNDAEMLYCPVSVFVKEEPLEVSFGWTNKSEVAIAVPAVAFRLYNPARELISTWTEASRKDEILEVGKVGWSGGWKTDILKVLPPGDYLLEAEIAPEPDYDDRNRENDDNVAVFRFAVRDPSLAAEKDVFDDKIWFNVERREGNDFAQQPHTAVREVMTNETDAVVMPTVQFGPYVPMNGVNGRSVAKKKPLDVVFLIDYTGSMSSCIAGLVNNIGNFIDKLFEGDPANGVAPIADLRVKIVGFSDFKSDTKYKNWFEEGAFTSDRAVLKSQLANLRKNCGYGGGNAGESAFDALYYVAKGWTPNATRTPSGYAATASGFREAGEATRAVLIFTDEPPHLPLDAPGCKGEDIDALNTVVKDAGINLTIIGDGDYYGSQYANYRANAKRHAQFVALDPDNRDLIETGGRGTLASFTQDATKIRELASRVSSKVPTVATVVEPLCSAMLRGAGTLRFDWKNDSTAGKDNTYSFDCDGITNLSAAADGTWRHDAITLGEGTHLFKWSYEKIDYRGDVTDCGVLANLVWEPFRTELALTPNFFEVEHFGSFEESGETNALYVAGDGNLAVTVSCNSIWQVATNTVPDWIRLLSSCGTGDGDITFQVLTNGTFKSRRAEITVRAGAYGQPTDDIVEKTFKVVQGPSVPVPTDEPQILTVDVKPRWPWDDWVDIDFLVALPVTANGVTNSVQVTLMGVNREGEDAGYTIPKMEAVKYCTPTSGYLDGNVPGKTYASCPTTGWYRISWRIDQNWYKSGTPWPAAQSFHTPKFSVQLTAQDSTDSSRKDIQESKCVRVDMRQSTHTGGFVMTGTERVGYPNGKVDPVPFDTTTLSNGWNQLTSLSNAWAEAFGIDQQLPDAYTNDYSHACVLNDTADFPIAVEGGTITTDTVWRADRIHLVRDNVFVAKGHVLTIEDGAIVKFCYATHIFLYGDTSLGERSGSKPACYDPAFYNIRIKGAYITVAGNVEYGGDTLFGITETDTSGAALGSDRFASQENWAESPFILGEGVNNAILKVSLMKDEKTSGTTGIFKLRYYTRGEMWGNLPYPSADGMEFYGWYTQVPSSGSLTPQTYTNKTNMANMVLPTGIALTQTKANATIRPLLKPKDWTDSVWPKMNGGEGTIALDSYEAFYDGAVHKPAVTKVTVHDSTIDPNNYKVAYGDGDWTQVGTYPVRVEFSVDYTNSPTAYFTIHPCEVSEGSAVFEPAERRYVKPKFGAVAEPAAKVTLPGRGEIPSSEYTVNWLGGRTWPTAGTWEPGTYAAEIRFTGNYTGTLTNTFAIVSNPDYYFPQYASKKEALANLGVRANGKPKRLLYVGGTTNDLMTAYVLGKIHDDLELNEFIIDNYVVWAEDPSADGSSYEAFAKDLAMKAQPLFAVLSKHNPEHPLAGRAGYLTNAELLDFLREALLLPDDASAATLELEADTFLLTGQPVHPTGKVTYDGETVPAEAYELVYAEDCTALGTYWAKAVFTSDSYDGYGLTGETARVAFSIVPRALKASEVALTPATAVYDGFVHRPSVTVPAGVACTVDYGLGYYVETGDYTLFVSSADPTCTGRVEKTFSIVSRTIDPQNVAVELDQDEVAFYPSKAPTNAVQPSVTRLTDGTNTYVEGRDYDVVYGPGNWMTNGHYEVYIVFKNGYEGTVTVPFTISIAEKLDASSAELTLDETTFVYSGAVRHPTGSVWLGTDEIERANYDLAYDAGCVTAGVYGVKAVFRGDVYTGETAKAHFTIAPLEITDARLELSATNHTFTTGVERVSAVYPTVLRVWDAAREYEKDRDYTVTFGAGDWTTNGTYEVFVTFTNNFAGSVSATFAIGEAEPEHKGLPDLPANPTEDDVTNALRKIDWADPAITNRIKTTGEYTRFNTWYTNVANQAGADAVNADANAFTSFRVSELTGESQMLTQAQIDDLEFKITEVDPVGNPGKVDLTVVLMEGDRERQLTAAKEAFAELVRRAETLDDLRTDAAKVKSSEVEAEAGDDGKSVRLSVKMPEGASGFMMLEL